MRRLIIDIETGGLNSQRDGITQLAGVVADYQEGEVEPVIVDTFSRILKPDSRFNYATQALNVQGKTIADLNEHGVPTMQAFAELQKFVVKHFHADPMCVSPWAHNAAFDLAFISTVCQRVGAELPCNRAYICSMVLWRLLREIGRHDHHQAKLDTVISHYEIHIAEEDRHSAVGDAIATAKAIGYMLNDLRLCSWPLVSAEEVGT